MSDTNRGAGRRGRKSLTMSDEQKSRTGSVVLRVRDMEGVLRACGRAFAGEKRENKN